MPDLPKQPRPTSKRTIRQAWASEHTAAHQARTVGDAAGEWNHLERAHILSQPLAVTHVRTHLAMLGYGIRHRDRQEIAGQLIRLLVAGPGSALGRYPSGNTGGADVSAITPMQIPPRPPSSSGRHRPGVVVSAIVTPGDLTSTTTRALSWGDAFGVAQAAVAMASWWLELRARPGGWGGAHHGACVTSGRAADDLLAELLISRLA